MTTDQHQHAPFARRGERRRRAVPGDARVTTSDLATELLAEGLIVGVGVVDPRGTVLEAPNLGWHGVDLARAFGTALGTAAHVANAAALGPRCSFSTASWASHDQRDGSPPGRRRLPGRGSPPDVREEDVTTETLPAGAAGGDDAAVRPGDAS